MTYPYPYPDDDLVEGDRVELTVGAPAHGGHCVARLGGEHGRVVFVRHTLPGERITAEVTEVHKGYLRADAVEIHEPSPDRVEPPCPFAHPGGCGGCDLQHVASDAQLRWKSQVVNEQLHRLAGLTDDSVRVEPLPPATSPPGPGDPGPSSPGTDSHPGGDSPPAPAVAPGTGPGAPVVAGSAGDDDPARLLGWRSRVRYAVDAAGRAGLLQHRSRQVVAIDRCRIAHPAIQELDLLAREWPDADAVEAVASSGGDVAVLAHPAGRGALPADDPVDGPDLGNGAPTLLQGPPDVRERAVGRLWGVPVESFWQGHPAAAETLTATVLEMLRPQAGEVSWDLYGGAGLFAAALATRTGARTTLVESSPAGVKAARDNLADLPVEVVEARVDVALRRRRITAPVDLIVLDPPRAGAGAVVVKAIAAAGPRAVAYVACDPAALARDVATFRSLGWEMSEIRAFDCFPMTQHIECVALLTPRR
ncbi:TRAM domain-containing protein [Actinoplanes sp. NPDC051411]|uniref:class I SAM-dependent RNA methyltransferase n=1 Tax=Actinoplanes sp. NPDC051411 TaxID=3155522 RepID=UPI00343B7D3A